MRHIIYVPGLGDRDGAWQGRLVERWSDRRVTAHYFPVHWSDKESYESKLQRLLDEIDRYSSDGPVCLVGPSAGASLVITAFSHRTDKVDRIIAICGKLDRPETVQRWRFVQNSAFEPAINGLRAAFDTLTADQKAQIISVRPLYDEVIELPDMLLPGIRSKRLWSVGHSVTIALAITLFRRTIKRLALN